MAKRDRRDFSNAIPTIKPEDIAPAKEAVFTCDRVEEKDYDDGKRLFLHVTEFPDKLLRIPVTSLDEIIEALGDDDDDWKTQIPVQVVKTMNPQTGKMQDVIHVAPASEWNERLSAYRKQVSAKPRVTSRVRTKARR